MSWWCQLDDYAKNLQVERQPLGRKTTMSNSPKCKTGLLFFLSEPGQLEMPRDWNWLVVFEGGSYPLIDIAPRHMTVLSRSLSQFHLPFYIKGQLHSTLYPTITLTPLSPPTTTINSALYSLQPNHQVTQNQPNNNDNVWIRKTRRRP